MKAYLITIVAMFSLELIGRVVTLTKDHFPIITEKGPGMIAAEAVVFIGFVIWGGVLLAQ